MAFTSVPPVSLTSRRCTTVCTRRSSFVSAPIQSRPTHHTASTATSTSPRMVFGQTVKQSLESAKIYSTLLALAEVAGVDLDVSNCTVFAPTDDAFSRTRPGLVEELLASPEAAKAVVLRHVLPKVVTSKQIKGCGFWDGVPGGPLAYQGIGPLVSVGGVKLLADNVDNECDNGTIHAIEAPIPAPGVKLNGVEGYYQPSVAFSGDSSVASAYPSAMSSRTQMRAANACMPSTTGGRKAMGLIKQQPFWMYGPPFNAAKQEDYEPISIAFPECGASVDYQLMPPGSVVVTPDEVTGAKLLPVSGMSKYIGKTKRLVEGDGERTYSYLNE